ncbi:MAG: DUF3857 domain-containing protein [Bacteroidales bacterium]|nr:DUF3857 domain-containing protein [Bacteroidales bacterium]
MKRLFLSFLLCFFIYSLVAQDVKSLLKSADYPGYDLLTVFDSTYTDMQESGLSYVNNRTLYKVLTNYGAKRLAVVKFDYDPLSAFIEVREVIIHRKDGTSEPIDIQLVQDYPAPARMIYWGARQKQIPIGRLEPGDGVEVRMFRKGFTYALLYSEEDDSKYIPPMKGHFYDIVRFFDQNPIKLKYYEVLIPENKTVQYKFYNGNVDSLIQKQGEKIKYAFTGKDLTPIRREPRMVDNDDVGPKLLISTSPDWEAKSTWFYGVNEDYGSFDSYPELDKKVAEILKNAKTEEDSISLLTHWVADNMRYSGISMGEGEGFTLHNAKMNFTDRCGVCKDKASLLIAMLRAAGFDSYAAMTMAGSRIDRIPADQFNHSITVVKRRNGEYQLLDPTWVPFVRELWSSREQQQNYLMGLPEGADLMETPISAPENHYLKINGKSEILPNGTLKGEFTLEAEGQSDASVRSMFTRNFKDTWHNAVERELKSTHPLIEVEEVIIPENPVDYMSGPVKISVKYSIPNYVIVSNEEIIFVPFIASNIFRNSQYHLSFDTGLEKRTNSFTSGCSQLVELNEEIILPKNCEKISLPENEKVEGSGADYEGNYLLEGNVLKMKQIAKLKKRRYEPEDWESFRKTVIAQKKFASERVILKVL